MILRNSFLLLTTLMLAVAHQAGAQTEVRRFAHTATVGPISFIGLLI